jgi:photosystem II stability/assembly factor-like uncharacterized protein
MGGDLVNSRVLVATGREVLAVDPERGAVLETDGLAGEPPTCLAADPLVPGRAWCGTHRGGVFRSNDRGATWAAAGLVGEWVMAVTASPARRDLIWAGTEPSAVRRSEDAGRSWYPLPDLETLPSASGWAFPPRPETHHVRWIAAHPSDPDRLWVAVEAGALVRTTDGGRSWLDRVAGSPRDTHELAVHPAAPDTLRVAAGDGYFESHDGGATWSSPEDGLEVDYLRSVAIDPGYPDTIVVSAAPGPRTSYVAGRSEGRVYRRHGQGAWARATEGWPDPPSTIAPLLAAGREAGELWAADERGVHRSVDGGGSWRRVASYETEPGHLRGLAVV